MYVSLSLCIFCAHTSHDRHPPYRQRVPDMTQQDVLRGSRDYEIDVLGRCKVPNNRLSDIGGLVSCNYIIPRTALIRSHGSLVALSPLTSHDSNLTPSLSSAFGQNAPSLSSCETLHLHPHHVPGLFRFLAATCMLLQPFLIAFSYKNITSVINALRCARLIEAQVCMESAPSGHPPAGAAIAMAYPRRQACLSFL